MAHAWLKKAKFQRKLVNETFRCCRSKEAWAEDAKPMADRKCKIYYAIHPLADFERFVTGDSDEMMVEHDGVQTEVTARTLRRSIRITLEEMGAVEAEGPAPKSETTRVVERNHRRARGGKKK